MFFTYLFFYKDKYKMNLVIDMKLIKRIIIFIIILGVAITCLMIGQGYQMYIEAIEEEPISEKIQNIKKDKNYITIDQLPKEYTDAVVAAEDHRFYKHNGIDIRSIGRAIITNIKAKALVEGGSTITQQVAKNIYFTQKKQFTRKIAEALMAIELEKNCNKEEILELYVNTSYFGEGYTGVKEACEGYFEKEPKDMNLNESTLLAGIPNAPSIYAPTKNLDLAKQRQKQVIEKMIKYGYLTQQEADKIMKI